jgi:hypothetical protein
MQVVELKKDAMYLLLDEKHNPPKIENQKDQNKFQSDIHKLYDRLIERLVLFGEEGDLGDFAIRPDLKIRPTVSGLAPHLREFTLSVLTEEFWRRGFLSVVYDFVCTEAMGYRIVVDQFVNSEWTVMIIFTADTINFCCTDVKETRRLKAIIANL